ncbi:hypothetical protein HPB47_010399 [Ixodes persulcatus]|uniref:Uncharacterized protein n=1 Tax=Ixodes persulcatus TaxID=34615 RepID=A0AC60NZ71_IXOPE|nr:hypothetical protein HPB47_010399 [Ixodes persulcatus]
MSNIPEFTTHWWGDAFRMPSNEAVPSSSMSKDQFFRNTEHHSLGTLMPSAAARLTLHVVNSSWADLRRSEHGDARRSPPMVTLKAGAGDHRQGERRPPKSKAHLGAGSR